MDKFKWRMVFGCHDNKVYSINIKNFQPSLYWKTQLTSPVYSTPCSLKEKYILAASNNGKLCTLDSETGLIVSEYQLPNETFSSPSVYRNYIFIGCRDDHLYCIKYGWMYKKQSLKINMNVSMLSKTFKHYCYLCVQSLISISLLTLKLSITWYGYVWQIVFFINNI